MSIAVSKMIHSIKIKYIIRESKIIKRLSYQDSLFIRFAFLNYSTQRFTVNVKLNYQKP